jgi:hypothetical protein
MERRHCLQLLAGAASLALAPALRAQPTPLPAAPTEVQTELPGARLQGSGRLRFFGLHIYDVQLWVAPSHPAEVAAREDYLRHAFMLELVYARGLEGRKIAERSIEEMERAGRLPPTQSQSWLAFMAQAFPNVEAGTRLSALHRPAEAVRFFVNGNAGAEIRDAEFARRFFGIWLAPQTSEPKMRLQLLGIGA